jgi:hypothetical protein
MESSVVLSMAHLLDALRSGHVLVACQVGVGEGGGIVLSPVEVFGVASALATAIGYMFKRVVDLGEQRVKDKEEELTRLAQQNERLLNALFQSTANTDRGLGLVERRVGVVGNA